MFQDFLARYCTLGPSKTARSSDLYTAFSRWVDERGLRHRFSVVFLSRQLQLAGFRKRRDARGIFWEGLAVGDQ